MLAIYLSVYIIVVLVVWGFYAVARMHTMKFKNFSTHIVPVTNALMIILIILTFLGFILIFFVIPRDGNSQVNSPIQSEITQQGEEDSSYQEEIIGNQYY